MLEDIKKELQTLGDAELHQAAAFARDLFKARARSRFVKDDLVTWEYKGVIHHGKITGCGPTNFKVVDAANNMPWRISPGALRKGVA